MNSNVASISSVLVMWLYFHLENCQTVANSGTILEQLFPPLWTMIPCKLNLKKLLILLLVVQMGLELAKGADFPRRYTEFQLSSFNG